jgi:hypothetical protein
MSEDGLLTMGWINNELDLSSFWIPHDIYLADLPNFSLSDFLFTNNLLGMNLRICAIPSSE